MTDTPLAKQPDSTESADVADLRDVPLAELPNDPDSDDLVGRILERQQYTSRVDVAAFQSAI